MTSPSDLRLLLDSSYQTLKAAPSTAKMTQTGIQEPETKEIHWRTWTGISMVTVVSTRDMGQYEGSKDRYRYPVATVTGNKDFGE